MGTSHTGGMIVVYGSESRCSDGMVVGIPTSSDANFGLVVGSPGDRSAVVD